jgi:hypothetical protein
MNILDKIIHHSHLFWKLKFKAVLQELLKLNYPHLKTWEICYNLCQFIMVILLGKLNFSHIKLSNTPNLVVPTQQYKTLEIQFY